MSEVLQAATRLAFLRDFQKYTITFIRGKPRLAHENPDVQRAYSEFLSKDGADLSEKLLHTTAYVDRSGELG